MRTIWILAAAVFALSVTAAMAQEGRPTLTPSQLDRYLKILPDLAKIVKEEEANFDMRNLDAIKGSQMESKVSRFLSQKGWKMEEFAWISHKVSGGIGYLMAKPQLGKLRQEMAAQKQEIMTDPDIPDSVKQQMLAMMEEQGSGPGGIMTRLDKVAKELTPSELKLLEANKDRIIKVYEGLGQ